MACLRSSLLPTDPGRARRLLHYRHPPSWHLALTATKWNQSLWLDVGIVPLLCIQVSHRQVKAQTVVTYACCNRRTGCYGVPKDEITDMWLCDPCANEKTLEASLVSARERDIQISIARPDQFTHTRTSLACFVPRASPICADRSPIAPASCPNSTFCRPSSRQRATSGRTSCARPLRRIYSGPTAVIFS